jgi:hypothetical protein
VSPRTQPFPRQFGRNRAVQHISLREHHDGEDKITYTELGRRVDELEVDLLEVPARGVGHQRFPECDDTLLGSGD